MTSGNGLARVSFLPGVLPPTAGDSGPEPLPESSQQSSSQQETSQQQRDEAEKISMRALTRRGQSRWELGNTLSRHDLDSEIVEAELDRLERVGLIDDAALANDFVRTRHERKGLGRSALTAELRAKHVDQQYIDVALEQIDDDEEQSRATELAVRRAGQLRSLDSETAKRRLTGFLLRKGYAGSVVRAAVDTALVGRGGAASRVQFR